MHLFVRASVCLYVCQSVCLCLQACVPACLRLVSIEIWDWRPAPFYVDKLELTVNRRTHFEGLFWLRLKSAACKIMSEKVVGRILQGLPRFAASCEGRTFGDEKG